MDSNSISENLEIYVAIFTLAVLVIAILSAVIIAQNRKIQKMSQPKYGFLGKPLAVFALAAFMIGSVGAGVYLTNQPTDQVVVNADKEYRLDIEYVQSGIATFNLKAIPFVDGLSYGTDDTVKFDIYWTITKGNADTFIEYDISKSNPSNLVVNLEKGKYTVKAQYFVGTNTVERTIDLEVK